MQSNNLIIIIVDTEILTLYKEYPEHGSEMYMYSILISEYV
jgi:hypothetical protein